MLAVLLLSGAGAARAAQSAPSAIDARVTAIPAARLLSQPPATLVDPARQRAAYFLARNTRPAWIAWIGFQIVAFSWLWTSGGAARLRDLIVRAVRRPPLVRFTFGAALTLVGAAAALPAQFYDYRILRVMGLSTERFGPWLGDWAISTLLEMIGVGAVIAVVLWLVQRTRLWWIYTMAGVLLVTLFLSLIYPIVVEPIFNHFTPLPPDRPLAQRIRELARRSGEGDPAIYVSNLSSRTISANAYVVGIGPTKRIVLGDTLLDDATEPEVLFAVAHELGHDVRHDTLWGSLVAAGFFMVGIAFAVLIADRIGFRRDDDPLTRLALVGALLCVVYCVLLPFANGYSRFIESRADDFALAHDPDRAAGTRLFVRFADKSMQILCPPRIVRLYWYDHPPIGTRISRVNGQPNPCP